MPDPDGPRRAVMVLIFVVLLAAALLAAEVAYLAYQMLNP